MDNQETNQTQVATPLNIGGNEYSPEEARELVEKGRLAREIEAKQNIKLDRVYPAFTKASQEFKEYKENSEREMSALRGKVPAAPESEEQAMKDAILAAKRLGIVTKEDFNEYMEKSFKDLYQREVQATQLTDQLQDLEKELDGSDGRPAFKSLDVLEYMRDNGIKNAEKAYKLMHEDALDKFKEESLKKAKKPSMTTEVVSSGVKRPSPVSINRDNINDLLRQALHGGE